MSQRIPAAQHILRCIPPPAVNVNFITSSVIFVTVSCDYCIFYADVIRATVPRQGGQTIEAPWLMSRCYMNKLQLITNFHIFEVWTFWAKMNSDKLKTSGIPYMATNSFFLVISGNKQFRNKIGVLPKTVFEGRKKTHMNSSKTIKVHVKIPTYATSITLHSSINQCASKRKQNEKQL